MKRSFATLAFSLLGILHSHAADAPQAELDFKHRSFFKAYCLSCHNAEKQKGKVRLDDIAFTLDSVERADLWQKVLNSINSGDMPPEDEKQPEPGAKTDFLDDLSRTLVTARGRLSDSGGNIAMRRLNRREYKNTLRDLLGVDLRVNELPADGGAGTFDTVGSSLFMSSDQFEQYLALGRQALDEHFARAAVISTKPAIQHVEAEEWANKMAKQFADMYQEGFDRWKAWQASGGKPPEDFKFSDKGAAEFAKVQFERHWPYFDLYQKLPLVKQGAYLTIYDITTHVEIDGGKNLPVGDYILRLRVGAVPGKPKSNHVIEVGHRGERKGEFSILSHHEITGSTEHPQILEIPVRLTTTSNRRFSIRAKQPLDPHAVFDMWNDARLKNGTGPTPSIWIDWVELEGLAVSPAAAVNAKPRSMHVEVEAKNAKIAKSLTERTDAHDRYMKWTAAVEAAAQKPENAAVTAKIRAEKKGDDRHFYAQWQSIQGAPSPKDFGFVDDIHADEQGRRNWVHYVPYQKAYMNHPATKTGTFLTIEDVFVNPYQAFRIPGDWPAGDYVVCVRIAATSNTPTERRFVEFGSQHDSGVRAVTSSHQIIGTMEKPQVLEIPLKFSPLNGHGFFFQEKGSYESEEVAHRIFAEAKKRNGIGPEFALWIDWIEVASANAANPVAKTIKERREVELHANAMVGGTYNGYFKGGCEAAKKFLETGKPQKGIPDETEAKFRVKVFEEHGPSFERYLNDPLTKTGAYLTIYNVHTEEVITLPPDQPSGWLKTKHELEKAAPGDYLLRFRIGAVKGTPKERHFVALGSRKAGAEDFTLLQTFQISGSTAAPQTIEVPVNISADGPRTFVLREKRDVKLDFETYTAARKEAKVGPPPALWIDWVEWEGPLVKPAPLAKTECLEPESRRAEVERNYKRYQFLNEQYGKWQAAGGDETRLKDFGFTDKSHAEFAKYVWDHDHCWLQQYLDRPLAKTGLYLDNTITETSEYAVDLPATSATGDYVMRVKIGCLPDMPAERAFLNFVEASPIDKDDRTFLTSKQITGTLEKPELIELPFKVRPGGPRKFILMEKRPLKKEAISLAGRTRLITDAKQRDPVLWIDWIEYEGPLNKADTKSPTEPVLSANISGLSDHDHARAVLQAFAQRAFRAKQPSSAYLDKLTALYDSRRKAGDAHEAALKEPLSVVLASPGFLYLQETGGQHDQAKGPVPLSPPELASRLSYFLWSAPPDEQLLKANLTQPDVIAHEVDRMIASAKADEFVSGFVHQWLGMDRLEFFQFDTKQFRDFDESAKAAARREVYETFAYLLRQHGSLSRLLKSDEIHINGLLATYYGIEGVSGDTFQKVTLSKDSPRGGLLGMAAILAMGSNGERTSPVERGAWVLRKLLNHPPPPAPPNVPQLDRLASKPISPHDRLLAHQEQPQCLQCHRKIDPIGFGLENFNAAGKWRDIDRDAKTKKNWPIDPSGQFYNGPAFKSYFDLRDLIAARSENFAEGFTEALIEYALGRPYGFTDAELAATIVKQAKAKDFAIREFIVSLAQSPQFQRK